MNGVIYFPHDFNLFVLTLHQGLQQGTHKQRECNLGWEWGRAFIFEILNWYVKKKKDKHNFF